MATPALRIRIAPKFPAKIQGSGGITVTRNGGVVTIGWSSLPPLYIGEAFALWFATLPTDPSALSSGDFWNNGDTLARVP